MPSTTRSATTRSSSPPPPAAPASKRKGAPASVRSSSAKAEKAEKNEKSAKSSTSKRASTPPPAPAAAAIAAKAPRATIPPPAPVLGASAKTPAPAPVNAAVPPPAPAQSAAQSPHGLPSMARSTPSSPPPSLRNGGGAPPASTRGGAPQSVRPSSPPRSGPPSIVPVHVPPPPKPILLAVGDKAVHPAHGVGEVVSIEHRELGGTSGEFYVLKILENGMKVMVPSNATSSAGLRPVMSTKEADTVLDTMRAREVAVDVQPWSRRFRAYTEMIKSGSPHEVAKVLRDMYRLKFDKDLSFGERRLLDQAKSLLMKELALAKKMTEAELREYVADIFRT